MFSFSAYRFPIARLPLLPIRFGIRRDTARTFFPSIPLITHTRSLSISLVWRFADSSLHGLDVLESSSRKLIFVTVRLVSLRYSYICGSIGSVSRTLTHWGDRKSDRSSIGR